MAANPKLNLPSDVAWPANLQTLQLGGDPWFIIRGHAMTLQLGLWPFLRGELFGGNRLHRSYESERQLDISRDSHHGCWRSVYHSGRGMSSSRSAQA